MAKVFSKVFVHLFNPVKKELILPLMPGVKVLNASLMNGNNVQLTELADHYLIIFPAILPDSISNVLVLQLDSDAINIPIITTNSK